MAPARLLLLMLVMALGLPAAAQQPVPPPSRTPSPGTTAPSDILTPRITVQAMLVGGIDMALWSPDSRHLYTASGLSREVLVWDVDTGYLIDRIALPSQAGSSNRALIIDTMRFSADGARIELRGVAAVPAKDVMAQGRLYLLDVRTRRISIGPAPAIDHLDPNDRYWTQRFDQRTVDFQIIYESGDAQTKATAKAHAALPPLPGSPDGKWRVVRAYPGIKLLDKAGQERLLADGQAVAQVNHADMSPDGGRLAFIRLDLMANDTPGENKTRIELFDMVTGQFDDAFVLDGGYDRVKWLDNDRLLVSQFGNSTDPEEADADSADLAHGNPPNMLVIDANDHRQLQSMPPRCFTVAMPRGTLIAAGLANCRTNAGTDRALVRQTKGEWRPLPEFDVPDGATIMMMAISPRGSKLLVGMRNPDGRYSALLVDPGTGAVRDTLLLGDQRPSMAVFSPGARYVWLSTFGEMIRWEPEAQVAPDAPPTRITLPSNIAIPSAMTTSGRVVNLGSYLDDDIEHARANPVETQRATRFPGVVAMGYLTDGNIQWAMSIFGTLRLWNMQSGKLLLTTNFLPNQLYVSATPEGRYDTNVGPESDLFRWVVPDAPFDSLAPQTFMRDYYEPRLFEKLISCSAQGNCDQVFKPLPSIASLNRALPQLDIASVIPVAGQPGWVDVLVRGEETRDSRTGQPSGLHAVKLLIDNREYASSGQPVRAGASLAEWRANTRVVPDAGGCLCVRFRVPLPSGRKTIDVAAYGFNADRVKSDNVGITITPPRFTPRRPRAFVLTIGIDHYREPQLELGFAVSDARLIAGQLAHIPDYEMHPASLTTSRGPDGRVQEVTADHVAMALAILAGADAGPLRAQLQAAGHDVSLLDRALPDDLVIISYSGHGFADASGHFSFVTSNASWPRNTQAPVPGTVLDTERVVQLLSRVTAGELAFIIDACHSGAAVDTPDFKPGPMGDPGLGQLAYDKNMRILAATQPGNLAMESASLGQGLLTAALADGLGPHAVEADHDGNGKLGLDEWLSYAVDRLPALAEESRVRGKPLAARGFDLVFTGDALARGQQPSLFDFDPEISPVMLRKLP